MKLDAEKLENCVSGIRRVIESDGNDVKHRILLTHFPILVSEEAKQSRRLISEFQAILSDYPES